MSPARPLLRRQPGEGLAAAVPAMAPPPQSEPTDPAALPPWPGRRNTLSSKTAPTPAHPSRYLDPDYRRPLVLSELLGFKADIMCLQAWQRACAALCAAGAVCVTCEPVCHSLRRLHQRP